MTHPMEAMLNEILDTASPPGEANVMLQLRTAAGPATGALRKHATIKGIFELLVIAQNPQGGTFPVSLFFAGEGVARVMMPREELKQRVTPASPGGLIIPS